MGREARNNASKPQEDESSEGRVRSEEGGGDLLPDGVEGEGPVEGSIKLEVDTGEPFILFTQNEEKTGLVGRSNIPNWEFIILKYARAFKDSEL